jgi:2-haloacid dehalogenase
MRYAAYLFDVQGTLLDFFVPVRDAISSYLRSIGEESRDAGELARQWRANYFRRIAALRQSVDCWTRVHDEYAAGFLDVCEQQGVAPPAASQLEEIAASWTRLVPWPDTAPGLARIRRHAITGSLSNADMQTMVRLFKRLDIDWDVVLTAEVFGAFKPDPIVYQRAVRYLGLKPHDVAMVACHPYDLRAAADVGLGTVFVKRPDEYGDVSLAHQAADHEFDQQVSSLIGIE